MRWVRGMPAPAVPPIPALIPGTMRNGTAGGGERQRLLGAAAEYQRIAALEAQHAAALPRQRDQALVDAELRRPGPAGALADRDQRAFGEGEDIGRDEGVMQDDVGGGEGVERVQGEQARVARPRADEPDGSGREFRQPEPRGGGERAVHTEKREGISLDAARSADK